MPIDYSKWDDIEISDDSDIEVHENIHKPSFINVKKQKIYHDREQRKLQIDTYKYERQINDQLIKRITALRDALTANASEAESNPAEAGFRAIMASAGNPKDENPPPRPDGVHANVPEQPTYTKMMATLLDQVNQTLEQKKPENRYAAMVEEIENHLKKVTDLQDSLLKSLADLEKEESRKITSESIRTGFNFTHIAKSTPSTSGEKKTESKVELLNPNFSLNKPDDSKTTESADDDGDIDASPDAVKFGQIKASSYRESHEFLATHPHILTEKETEGLLVLAFESQLENKDDVTRNYVHQALLIQYCRALGKDGVALGNGVQLFFTKIVKKGHDARKLFCKDVEDTYLRIKNRATEINKERALGGHNEVTQIQLRAADRGTEIEINVPPENSEDPDEKHAREIFEGFAPEMREAIKSGNLDSVNEMLGRMKVSEAEKLVELLTEAGIVNIEEQIIDTTTEEGKKKIKELEEDAAKESYADGPE